MTDQFKHPASYLLVLILSLMSAAATADEDFAWQQIKDGKAVILMRHAYAPEGGSEPSAFTPQKCSSERNLSIRGQQQAKKVGNLFRSKGINTANVYSSYICRCIDTGKLFNLGDVENLTAINPIFENWDQEQTQTAALNDWIRTAISEQSGPNILISHGFNIGSLMGYIIGEGSFIIIGIEGSQLVTLHQESVY
jgi:broad specificity phosphatase PhoE